MPRFRLMLDASGPLLRAYAAPPQVYMAETDPFFLGRALIDTGASMSHISPETVKKISPPKVGVEPVGRSGNVSTYCDTYLIRIKPCGIESEWVEAEVAEIEPASPGVDLIIGRDILGRSILYWDGLTSDAWIEW